jgi:hypothetical protein
MSSKAKNLLASFLTWTLLSAAYGVWFIYEKVNLPSAEGYEKDWQFQFVNFAVTRGLYLLAALAILLGLALVEYDNTRRR